MIWITRFKILRVTMNKKKINTFDIDGVIYMGQDLDGIYPGPDDLIITGRSIEESPETLNMLRSKGIFNNVHFNPLPFNKKTRKSSGEHKARVIRELKKVFNIGSHYEDDPVQAEEILKIHDDVNVILLHHELTEKENVRHL